MNLIKAFTKISMVTKECPPQFLKIYGKIKNEKVSSVF